MNEVLTQSATELAAHIAAGDLSSTEVVTAHIDRILEVNPALNAVVVARFDEALEEARAADKARSKKKSRAKLGPLHGVPCTIKEFMAVEGLPHTAGVWARRNERAPVDSPVVARLKAAGAIVLGLTNAPEGGLWYESNNPVYGRTSNPWDLYRTSGGSSGGEGAIIAAGGSPFGIGSDVGGSIRIPASLCGISGIKPTGGMVPSTGHFPNPPSGEVAYMQAGPMARDARDLKTLLAIISGPDGQDPQCRDWPLQDVDAVNVSDLTVHTLPGNGRAWVRKNVRNAVESASSALLDMGATASDAEFPDLSRTFEIWAAVLTECGDKYADIVGGGQPIPLAQQLASYPFGRSNHSASVLFMMALERVLELLPSTTASLADEADRLRANIETVLGPSGVLLHPVTSRTAPRHRATLLGNPLDPGLTTAFNITTLPAAVVPVGLDADGLPLAVQIIARRGHDHVCLAVAEALQAHYGRLPTAEPKWGKPLPFGLQLHLPSPNPGQTP